MSTYGKRQERYRFKTGDDRTGQCSVCMEVFYGEQSFDMHRRGEHPHGRYCIDPSDPPVSAAGLPAPYWLDGLGRWHYGRRRPSDSYADRLVTEAQGCENPTPGISTTPQGLQALTDRISA